MRTFDQLQERSWYQKYYLEDAYLLRFEFRQGQKNLLLTFYSLQILIQNI
jgi:hypothetical protein